MIPFCLFFPHKRFGLVHSKVCCKFETHYHLSNSFFRLLIQSLLLLLLLPQCFGLSVLWPSCNFEMSHYSKNCSNYCWHHFFSYFFFYYYKFLANHGLCVILRWDTIIQRFFKLPIFFLFLPLYFSRSILQPSIVQSVWKDHFNSVLYYWLTQHDTTGLLMKNNEKYLWENNFCRLAFIRMTSVTFAWIKTYWFSFFFIYKGALFIRWAQC